MEVRRLPEVEAELDLLTERERNAIENAFEKLEIFGDRLPYPHSSHVAGSRNIRELRPRSGRSPWRAFYGRVGDDIVIAAIGPEARKDNVGFRRAVHLAEERLDRF